MSLILPSQEEMAQYGSRQPFVPGSDVENPFNERHDYDATNATIERILADGTPNWVKWPKDFKSMAMEDFAAHRETSEKMGEEYRWHDQAILTDKKARQVNGIETRLFIEKLQKNGLKTAVFDLGWKSVAGVPTVGLFCVPPDRPNKLRAVCYMDVPMMYEWSVLHLDYHGIPSGEATRGWRTVAVQLVEKDIITESQCHRIFGAPPGNKLSDRYYRSLWEKRHGKPYVDEEEREGFQE